MGSGAVLYRVQAWVAMLLLLFVGLAVGAGTVQQHADPDPPVAPAQSWQIGIYLVTAFCLMLAAAGGVGAVAVLVNFYIVIGGPEHVPAGIAVGMISCVMAGSGIVHVIYYSTQRHPVFKDRALIEPNLMILITAPGIAGVALGGLANRVAPVWLVYVCLMLVMLVVSYLLYRKAVEAYHNHTAAVQVKRAASVALSRSFVGHSRRFKMTPPVRPRSPIEAAAAVAVAAADASARRVRQKWQAALKKLMAARLTKPGAQLEQQQQQQQQQQDQGPWPAVVVVQGDAAEEQVDLDLFAADASDRVASSTSLPNNLPPILQHNSRQLQSFCRWESFAVMQQKNPLQKWRKKHFVLLALMIAAAALPGTAALAHCGSGRWFLAVLSGLPVLLGVLGFTGVWLAVYVGKVVRQQQRRQVAAASGYSVPDLPVQQWTIARLIGVPAACLFAGLLNGFIGTGGAFILARIALAVDTHPAAMAATLQSSVLGWAASGLGVYGLLGQVPWGMGGILMMIAAASTALGHATVSQYIKRTGRFWMILAILAVCAAVSAAMAVYNTAVVLRIVTQHPELWTATGTICHKVTL